MTENTKWVMNNVEKFKWTKFPLECIEYSIMLYLNNTESIRKHINYFKTLCPNKKVYSNTDTSLFELSNLVNSVIILNMDIVDFQDFTDSFYLNKIFNNRNHIIGYSISSTPFPEMVYTRFEHALVEKTDNRPIACLDATGLDINGLSSVNVETAKAVNIPERSFSDVETVKAGNTKEFMKKINNICNRKNLSINECENITCFFDTIDFKIYYI